MALRSELFALQGQAMVAEEPQRHVLLDSIAALEEKIDTVTATERTHEFRVWDEIFKPLCVPKTSPNPAVHGRERKQEVKRRNVESEGIYAKGKT